MNKTFFAIFDQMFDVVQILLNTIKKGVQPEKRLVTKQCLIVFLSPNISHFGQAFYACVHNNILHSVASQVYFGTAKMRSMIVCQRIQSTE